MRAICRQSLGVHQKTQQYLFEDHTSEKKRLVLGRFEEGISDDKGQDMEALKTKSGCSV